MRTFNIHRILAPDQVRFYPNLNLPTGFIPAQIAPQIASYSPYNSKVTRNHTTKSNTLRTSSDRASLWNLATSAKSPLKHIHDCRELPSAHTYVKRLTSPPAESPFYQVYIWRKLPSAHTQVKRLTSPQQNPYFNTHTIAGKNPPHIHLSKMNITISRIQILLRLWLQGNPPHIHISKLDITISRIDFLTRTRLQVTILRTHTCKKLTPL